MKSLQEQFKEEAECHNYCTGEAEKRIKQRDYIGAAVFLENASRSLKEMDKLQKDFADLSEGKITIQAIQLGGRLQ